jgi:hypothetical protein
VRCKGPSHFGKGPNILKKDGGIKRNIFFSSFSHRFAKLYLASAVVEFLAKSKFCLHLVDGRYRRRKVRKAEGGRKIKSAGVG